MLAPGTTPTAAPITTTRNRVFAVGSVVDRKYEVVGIVGSGGMGTVMKVRRVGADTVLALKYCHVPGRHAAVRFAREVRLTGEIRHPNVIKIVDEGLGHKPPYFVMPFAKFSLDRKLHEYIGKETRVIDAMRQLCLGAQAVHNAGAVHRDIKPSNVLLLEGRLVLADLGLAKPRVRESTIVTRTATILGTDKYLAPEQRLPGGCRDADGRSDIFALGRTLYELLTGLDPRLVEIERLSTGLAHIIRKATAEHPNDRYQRVGQLMDALQSYASELEPGSDPAIAFEAVVSRVSHALQDQQYRGSDVRQMLRLLIDDKLRTQPQQFLQMFDAIPHPMLHFMPAYSEEFLHVLHMYVSAIDRAIDERSFAYADDVTHAMEMVFSAPGTTSQMRSLAVEAVLIAGARRMRHAALDVLGAMLRSITDNSEAISIRQVLSRRRDEYRKVQAQMTMNRLHPTIRTFHEELIS